MKKIIFGIFAHPDDESFGPAATLLQETKNGAELHLIMLTAGDAGSNPDNVPDLVSTRLEEWHQAGALLGATTMHFLGYKDGQLSNLTMIEITEKVQAIVEETLSVAPSDTKVEFMSFDFSGLSGHIDHIVATRAACLVFYRLKPHDTRLDRLRLYCLHASHYPTHSTDWLYREAGKHEHEIDEVVDARDLQDDIVAIMRCHHSQRRDCERILEVQGNNLGINYFIVKT
jgi:N-acetylglucosamine malate deacetylase 2